MADQSRRPVSAARRRLLQALSAGGGLASAATVVPNQWRRPLIDAVLLPAHAQVSGGWYGVVMVDRFGEAQNPARNGLFARMAGKIVPQARAGTLTPTEFPYHICVAPDGDQYWIDVVAEDYINGEAGIQFAASATADNIYRDLDIVDSGDNCGKVAVIIHDIRLSSVNENADGDIRIGGRGGQVIPFSIPMQPCNLPGLGRCSEIPGP